MKSELVRVATLSPMEAARRIAELESKIKEYDGLMEDNQTFQFEIIKLQEELARYKKAVGMLMRAPQFER